MPPKSRPPGRCLGVEKDAHLGGGRRQDFGDALGRGPAWPPVGRDTLRAVEGSRVEPRLAGQARCGQVVFFREPVDRLPDPVVGQHARPSRGVGRNSASVFRRHTRHDVAERNKYLESLDRRNGQSEVDGGFLECQPRFPAISTARNGGLRCADPPYGRRRIFSIKRVARLRHPAEQPVRLEAFAVLLGEAIAERRRIRPRP